MSGQGGGQGGNQGGGQASDPGGEPPRPAQGHLPPPMPGQRPPDPPPHLTPPYPSEPYPYGGYPDQGYPPPYGYGQPYPAPLDKSTPTIMYVLYLVAFLFAPTAIAGLIVAYANRGSGSPIADAHYTYAIRTFWLGLLYALAAALTFIFVVGGAASLQGSGGAGGVALLALLVLIAPTAWWVTRCVRGLVFLHRGAPVPNPAAWLW